jgi:ankyrin repeat protein
MSETESNIPGKATLAAVFALSAAEKNALLLDAARNGRSGLIQAALKAGADVNHADDNGDTALIHAARKGALEIVQALLAANADPLCHNMKGETAQTSTFSVMNEINSRSEAGQPADSAAISLLAYNLGRVGGLLYQAEKLATVKAIASCESGVPEKMTVRGPLKLKRSTP